MTARKTTTPAKPAAVEVSARALADAIALVRPFAGTDDTLPMLNGFRIEVYHGDLYVSATDRYALGAARIAAGEDGPFPETFDAFMPAKLASRTLAIFKPARRGPDQMLRLSVHGTQLAVENLSRGSEPSTRLVGAAFDFKPVPIVSMIGKVLASFRDEPQHPTRIGLNARFLARFAVVEKVVLGHELLAMRPTAENKPLIMTVGDRFLGLLMPVRFVGDSELQDFGAWFDRFDAPAPPKPETEPKPEPKKRPAKAAKPRARKAKSA